MVVAACAGLHAVARRRHLGRPRPGDARGIQPASPDVSGRTREFVQVAEENRCASAPRPSELADARGLAGRLTPRDSPPDPV